MRLRPDVRSLANEIEQPGGIRLWASAARPMYAPHRPTGPGHRRATRYRLPAPRPSPGRRAPLARRPHHSRSVSTRQSVSQIRRNCVTENATFAVPDRRNATLDLVSAVDPRSLNRPGKGARPGTPCAIIYGILGWTGPKLRHIHYRHPVADEFTPARGRACARDKPGVTPAQSAAPRGTHPCPRPAVNRPYSSPHRSAKIARSQDAISAFIYNPPIQLKILLDYCAKFLYIVNHIRCNLYGKSARHHSAKQITSS